MKKESPVRPFSSKSGFFSPDDKQNLKPDQDPSKQKPAEDDEKKVSFSQKATDFIQSTKGKVVLGSAAVGLILVTGMGTWLLSEADQPQAQENQTATISSEDFADKPAAEGNQYDYFSATRVLESLPADHWAKNQAPLDELLNRAVDQALVQTPSWDPSVGGLKMGPDTLYPIGSPQYNQVRGSIINRVRPHIQEELRLEPNKEAGPSQLILIKDPSMTTAGESGGYRIITQGADYEAIMTNTIQQAVPEVNAVINEYKLLIPQEPPAPVEPKIIEVDNGITTAQRAEFVRLLEEQKSWNNDLRQENQRLKDELQTLTKQTADLMQKVEDSPQAQTTLKARMLAKESGYKLQAIQGDLIFLEDKQGKVHSLRLGQTIPGTDLVIANADADTGIIYVTKK